MQGTIALLLRHLLSFTPERIQQLPASPQQTLAADFLRVAAGASGDLAFRVPRGAGLAKPLTDLCALYGAIRYFYCGEIIRLRLNFPSQTSCPWLEILPLDPDEDAITVNGDGTLAAFLPDLPPGRCTSYLQREFNLTPELIAWLAKKIWNFSTLRPGQYPIIERLCRGLNTLAILPTGAGKSLCFQLPAQLLPGITLVVSPLKSLMRDQYVNLRHTGIQGADFIDSSKTAAEKAEVLRKLKSGAIKLLYLSPERLQIESFQQELAAAMENKPISLFAIDEAHCISEWGHDFRPSYLRLRRFIGQLHNPPICALTATASHYVRQDILTLLGLNTQDLITPGTLDRREISLEVRLLAQEENLHQELLKTVLNKIPQVLDRTLEEIHRQGAGVVFTPYAAPQGKFTQPLGSKAVSDFLQRQGQDCRHYHAQLPDSQRIAIQDSFKDNAFPLLVATKGYGMGIDKENIDYVVHLSAPASLEAYYQEAGRAGRDGEHAHSVIIARPRLDKCLQRTKGLPGCSRGWQCEFTGGEKCSYGIQAGLLAQEYPSEQEVLQQFTGFLEELASHAQGDTSFRYLCPAGQSSRQQKYLYYLEQFGAVKEYIVLEYRRLDHRQYDLLLAVELAAADSLAHKYWLANKVAERIETYKAQKLNMLNTIQLYIKTDTCRRRFLMQYFGDKTHYERCNFCDCDGISPAAAPAASRAANINNNLQRLEEALRRQSLPEALALVKRPGSEQIADDITVRSMRELEDRPYNPAALYLAGFYSCGKPYTRNQGLRNLQAALAVALETQPQLLPQFFAQLPSPDIAYALSVNQLDRLAGATLQQLAAALEPPEQYPDVHLAFWLPQLREINQSLLEVPIRDH